MSTPTVLVTGSSGFIASHLVERLARLHPTWTIVALDKLDFMSNTAHESLPPNCIFEQADLCDGTRILAILQKYHIDTVAHLAAQSSVDRSFINVQSFLRDNVIGTQVLLDAMRLSGQHIRLMHMSTDEVYGSVTETVDETAQLLPTNPYAASKAAAEMMVRAHRICHGLDVVIARCNNVYGPNQHCEKLIPRFVKLLKTGQKCTVHGDGSVKRRFLHVNDACEALELLMFKGVSGEAYNIGALDAVSVIDVTKTIVKQVTGATDDTWREYVEFVPDRLFNDLDYNTSNDKICALGWKPIVTMESAIAELC